MVPDLREVVLGWVVVFGGFCLVLFGFICFSGFLRSVSSHVVVHLVATLLPSDRNMSNIDETEGPSGAPNGPTPPPLKNIIFMSVVC